MTHGCRRPLLTSLALVAMTTLTLGACGPTTTAPTVAPTIAPTTSSPPSTPPASAAASAPSATPSAATAACEIAPQTGRLPSDRLVDIVISSAADSDVVTFVFGNDSLPGPAAAPEGTLETALPPFIQGGSGEPLTVDGEHVALIRFAGMSIANDVGQPVYDGDMEFRPEFPALRHVVNMEMFEGVVSWYIGFDGPGCVRLNQDGQNVSIEIEHAAS